jgi:RNA polymerase sigma-70 factor, ECF subfamily
VGVAAVSGAGAGCEAGRGDPAPTHAGDLELARRVAGGDAVAFAELHDAHAARLGRFLGARTRDTATAEDALQCTWRAAWLEMGSYRGEQSLYGWLCGIAVRQLVTLCRNSEAQLDGVAAVLRTYGAQRLTDELTPERAALSRELQAEVARALARVEQTAARALWLRYALDYTVDEIARALGRSYKAAEALLSRGREQFRAAAAGLAERVTRQEVCEHHCRELIRMMSAGQSLHEATCKLGMDRKTAGEILRRNGYAGPRTSYRTERHRRRVAAAARLGAEVGVSEVARALGVQERTAEDLLVEARGGRQRVHKKPAAGTEQEAGRAG